MFSFRTLCRDLAVVRDEWRRASCPIVRPARVEDFNAASYRSAIAALPEGHMKRVALERALMH